MQSHKGPAAVWSRTVCRALALTLLLAGCGVGEPARESAAPAAGDRIDPELVAQVREAAQPLTGAEDDYDALLDLIGDARVVLLGEATHGTHEFYRARARITQRLITEKDFDAVAVEADWPEALRVNRYVRGTGSITSARRALSGFEEFPTWMWRNADVLRFVEWLREYNQALPPGADKVGFYGIDLQILGPAAEAVVDFLDPVDPAAAERARRRYACFRRYRDDPAGYGQAAEIGTARACTAEVAEQVRELESRATELRGRGGDEEFFGALQSARMLQGAEEYFRAMFLRDVSTWNLRDRYMADVLEILMEHLDREGEPAKIVVWAHNSHVGDARATHMADQGELNLGQLARERWGEDAVLIGFTTHTGTVIAASDWGAPAERKRVRPALPESYEALFHATGLPAFLLPLRPLRGGAVGGVLGRPRLERAIGVIYLPQTERLSHYFHADLPAQFDAVIHFDRTTAVEPLGSRFPGLSRAPPPNATRGAPHTLKS